MHVHSWGSVPVDTRLEQLTSDLSVRDTSEDEATPPHTSHTPSHPTMLNNSQLEVVDEWPDYACDNYYCACSQHRGNLLKRNYCQMKGGIPHMVSVVIATEC